MLPSLVTKRPETNPQARRRNLNSLYSNSLRPTESALGRPRDYISQQAEAPKRHPRSLKRKKLKAPRARVESCDVPVASPTGVCKGREALAKGSGQRYEAGRTWLSLQAIRGTVSITVVLTWLDCERCGRCRSFLALRFGVRCILVDTAMEYLKASKKTDNSFQQEETEEDIEFVSEGVLRPVLECIDLSNEEEFDTSSEKNVKHKDHVDYQKAKVASTLDRLARHVEVEKQLKEEKNKAFKEKLDSQHAHGLQELEFIRGHSDTEAARLCVNQWLKMPGLKPGTVNSGRRILSQKSYQSPSNSKSILCPIMHCNRMFDNGHLLLGHLKRFDHSPCDPTITLHGPPANLFACIVCGNRFASNQQYSGHLLSKVGENDGHERNYPPQLIQCFACPCCFLFFSIRDECLQHMSGKNHFSQAFKLSDKSGSPLPLPLPAYAKNLLISLCKEVPFQVQCSSCHQVLQSHMELTAHFRIQCRNAGPVAISKNCISEIAEILKAKSFCQGLHDGHNFYFEKDIAEDELTIPSDSQYDPSIKQEGQTSSLIELSPEQTQMEVDESPSQWQWYCGASW
ncbi:zinc finger protein [Crotalus adamanteus]|uniref:Zinc finger protein n=1 Tax=Crotalus adamanteus TaxID=8729 RepID=A0AAW1CAF7_CROAD